MQCRMRSTACWPRLTDDDQQSSARGGPDGKEVRDPAIGDLAAEGRFSERWKKPQLFDIYAHLGQRERQRLVLRNVWLERSGRKPMPVPGLRKINPVPGMWSSLSLKRCRTQRRPTPVKPRLQRSRSSALQRFPPCGKFLQRIKPDNLAHKELDGLAQRMAMTVEEVRLTADSVEPNKELRSRIDAMQDRPITSEGLIDLLRFAAHEMPALAASKSRWMPRR